MLFSEVPIQPLDYLLYWVVCFLFCWIALNKFYMGARWPESLGKIPSPSSQLGDHQVPVSIVELSKLGALYAVRHGPHHSGTERQTELVAFYFWSRLVRPQVVLTGTLTGYDIWDLLPKGERQMSNFSLFPVQHQMDAKESLYVLTLTIPGRLRWWI